MTQLSLFDLPPVKRRPIPEPIPEIAPIPVSPPVSPDLEALQAEARETPGRLWSEVFRAQARCWRAAGDVDRADALDRQAASMGAHRVPAPPAPVRLDRRPKLMFRTMPDGPHQIEVWALNPETDGWRCVRTVRPATMPQVDLEVMALLNEIPNLFICQRPRRTA